MSTRRLPAQYAIRCDWCRDELDHDGIVLHFEAECVVSGPAEHGWRSLDGKHMCANCSEDRGVDADAIADAAVATSTEGERHG
jgi:hypothetical protein